MNFNVDPNLKQAITSFTWAEQVNNAPLTIDPDNLDAVVSNIYRKIMGASAIRGTLEQMQGPISLVDTCYLVVQDQDKKIGSPETLNKIQQATEEERSYLNRSYEKLSLDFVQIEPNDLKAIVLLFGIKHISALATKKIMAFMPETTQIEQIEKSLTQLKILRSKYDISSVPEAQKQFLMKIDEQIQEQTEILESLKRASSKAVA